MTTKTDIIDAIKAAADATGDNNIRISLGATGNHLKNTIGETKPTGAAWNPEPKTWPVICEGLANWADSLGISGVKDKLNDLIGQYNQLLEDYNNSTVPSSASEVDPLP